MSGDVQVRDIRRMTGKGRLVGGLTLYFFGARGEAKGE